MIYNKYNYANLSRHYNALLQFLPRISRYILTKNSLRNVIANTYVYLVENMHIILNKRVEHRHCKGIPKVKDLLNLSISAEESYELGEKEEAERHYINIVESHRSNPDAWLKYAIFLLRKSEVFRALECCKEAINLDSRHKIALLLYGGILSTIEHYKEAQIFLKALTHLYPEFMEGWLMLHLFYILINYYPGINITLQMARKCTKDAVPLDTSFGFLNIEPFGWSPILCPTNRIYISLTIILLQLNLYKLAEVILLKELALIGMTTSCLYYMSVLQYLNGRNSDALYHLEEAKNNFGMNYSICSLMGHCHYQEENFKEAIYFYELCNSLPNKPDDIHLVQLKMGYCYIKIANYKNSIKVFSDLCHRSSTCKIWLGLGIAFYELNELKNAEIALMEANRIECCNVIVWSYLCLLNLSLQRYDEFSQCYRQVIKYELKDAKLWYRITNYMDDLGYSSTDLTTLL